MLVIPAIDIKDGKCVRLTLGRMETAHIYYEDPFKCADYWIEQGAKRLHLVDLDAAVGGGDNRELLCQLIQRNSNKDILIQVGGGIRDEQTATHYLDVCAADYIIVGTWAIKQPAEVVRLATRFPDRIYLSLDIADERVRLEGWTEEAGSDTKTILNNYAGAPLAGIVMTDIARDGTLAGIRTEPFVRLNAISSFPVIAAGGVHEISDLVNLKKSGAVVGAICGKSLYEKTLDLKEALGKLAAT